MSMEHTAQMLQSIAPLAWVAFAFTALFVFKSEISRALGRLEEGEFFGQKLKLRKDLSKLETSTAPLKMTTPELPSTTDRHTSVENNSATEAVIKKILDQAATSPKVALMTLSAELEKAAVHGLATRGMLAGKSYVPLSQAVRELQRYGLSPNFEGSLRLFQEVRNAIIHGGTASDDDALRALDSGMTIFRAIHSLPNQTYVVYHPGVEIFSDASCSQPFPEGRGIILESTSPGGVIRTKQIFASTRTHFRKGRAVAWEWSLTKQWGPAWYRDPDTGEVISAWGGCSEFVGRHLEDLPESHAGQHDEG